MVFHKKGEKVASNAHQSFNQSSNNMGVRIVWCKKRVRIVWVHPSYRYKKRLQHTGGKRVPAGKRLRHEEQPAIHVVLFDKLDVAVVYWREKEEKWLIQ